MNNLEQAIDHCFEQGSTILGNPYALAAFFSLRDQLEKGSLRAAEPDPASPTGWRVNPWVKRGILLGFRLGNLEDMSGTHPHGESVLAFVDKHTYPARRFTPADKVRIVPGGSSVRSGAYVAPSVVIMPPAYINAGAYVGEGTMVDSHALVGSCAQIGQRVHLSAAAQIGGVLEPVNASPVIIEDDVLVGGNTGVYEGTIVRTRAVPRRRSHPHPRHPRLRRHQRGHPPSYPRPTPYHPSGAVVVPGSRAITQGPGRDLGLSVYTPLIVKYRDEKTELSLALEDLLR